MFRKIAITASFPIFLLAAMFIPFDRLPSMCLFNNATGLPCPTCGMTRSVMALAHLHLFEAIHFNALGPAFVMMVGALWVCALHEILIGAPTKTMDWVRRKMVVLILASMAVFLVFGVLRIWLLMRN
jgi:hypothetical protein